MKILKQLFTIAAIALLMTACNKNDELAPEQSNTFPADGIIRVATSVKNPQTRAGMTTEDIQEFQLRILNENSEAYSYYAYMKKHENEWGSFIPLSWPHLEAMTLLWQNKMQPVKVAAVCDMLSLIDEMHWDFGYMIRAYTDQESELSMRNNDVLYMKEKVINPSEDLVGGKIEIALNHRLSKLNLTVKMGTEFNKLDGGTGTNLISDISVGGTYTVARWKILEDDMSGYDERKDITPWYNNDAYTVGVGDTTQAEAKYECILLPQTVASYRFRVSFTIGTRGFSWTSPAEVVIAEDTQYNLTLNVGKDVVTVAGFTATPWTEANEQNIGTE